jgi:hypothetical protein
MAQASEKDRHGDADRRYQIALFGHRARFSLEGGKYGTAVDRHTRAIKKL